VSVGLGKFKAYFFVQDGTQPLFLHIEELMSDIFSDISVTSPRTLLETSKRIAEANQLQRKGIQSQIQSAELIADQKKLIAEMAAGITLLLEHNQKQAADLAKQTATREKLESKRFLINTILSFVAAISGIVAIFVSIW
jgi:hypothetical protein